MSEIDGAADTESIADLAAALVAVRTLREENRQLRQRLGLGDSRPAGAVEAARVASATLSPGEKVALFRSLFRGRDDVYAQRWEAADGRHGYAPVLRPGARHVRGKPTDPVDCLGLTDVAIRQHLEGRRVLGVYPLMLDETTWFLALDLDGGAWADDAKAMLATCRELGLPTTLERSRSGEGGHIWVFFEHAIPASLARNLGCVILTGSLNLRHQLEFASYDRMFPNQDTMPRGGFGNLIALPLQGQSRRMDNAVFVDHEFEPHLDQWAHLAAVPRMTRHQVEAVVGDAAHRGSVIGVGATWFDVDESDGRPWELPPSRQPVAIVADGTLPPAIELTIASRVFVPVAGLPPVLLGRLRRLAAFQNPEFYAAQRMRLSTFGKPRIIGCSEAFPDHLALPRGCLDAVRGVLAGLGIDVAISDRREAGSTLEVQFTGTLNPDQQRAARALVRHDTGVLSAPTAFGKTVIGAWLVAERAVSTLILVHRRILCDQWRERLASFLGIPIAAVGQIGAGKHKVTGAIDVAVLGTLSRRGEVDDLVAGYGQVIVDECHHIPALSFERVLAEVRARYVVGLTATPTRKDGHQPIVMMQCGPVRHRADARAQAAARPFDHVVIPVHTTFSPSVEGDSSFSIQRLYGELARDEVRTDRIVEDVVASVAEGRSPLVLTERSEHLDILAAALASRVAVVVVLRGGMGARQRKAAAAVLAEASPSPRVVLATGRYAGEGFDDARLDTLFLAMPVAWRGTIQQYAGRLHRLHSDKRVVRIHDYVDDRIPVLERMFQKRVAGYRAVGYRIEGIDQPTAGPGTPLLIGAR